MALPKYVVTLSEEERARLRAVLRGGVSSARTQTRARVLLKADAGLSDAEIVEAVGAGIATVHRIRQRCVEEGFEAALIERKRPGVPPKFTPKQHAHLLALACSDPPAGRARWTLRLLAERVVVVGLATECSYETVRRLLKKTPLSRGTRARGASPRSARRS